MLLTTKLINEAIEELNQKSYEQIERETAIKWACRYRASQKIGKEDLTYRQEAVEHGAMAGIEFLIRLDDELNQ
ncbi:MAG TPA: hypothetical protein VKR58_09515 [Aquella sp.]|nr:hypothetical protein [Aquella sp.]